MHLDALYIKEYRRIQGITTHVANTPVSFPTLMVLLDKHIELPNPCVLDHFITKHPPKLRTSPQVNPGSRKVSGELKGTKDENIRKFPDQKRRGCALP